jgi:hypothetical protein
MMTTSSAVARYSSDLFEVFASRFGSLGGMLIGCFERKVTDEQCEGLVI